MSEPVKTSVYLTQESIDSLKRIAKKRGTTMAEVLRQAVATVDFLDQEKERGAEILVKDKDSIKQLVRL
jgi:ribbon-helix-helix CopG family protein